VNATLWSVNSPLQTTLGNAVYTFGDRFVTSRITFSPYRGSVECRNLQTGALLWTSPFISNTAILYVIGFTEDGVYVNDYATGEIYALYPEDGRIRWKAPIRSTTFGAYPGCVFACNGDPILAGRSEDGRFTVRLDKHTGQLVWSNNTLIAVTPNAALAAAENRVYRITGGITLPIVLTAIDIETGKTLYSSSPIPGDGDQENPITLGPGGKIYFWRDGGKLYAYEDDGNSFRELWSYTPQVITGAALSGNISLAVDGDLYVFDTDRVLKLDQLTGDPVSGTASFSFSQPSISVGADSTVYLNDGKGQFYAYTADLQNKKWQLAANGNVYCNPALAKDGILVLTQAGTRIIAYKYSGERAPVADISVSKLRIMVGESVDFYDQSSYGPEEWEWTFTGARTASSSEKDPRAIFYDAEGVYDVGLRVRNAHGADSLVAFCKIEVVSATATENELDDWDIRIYPNPARDGIWVQAPVGAELQIHNLQGSVCYRGQANGENHYIALPQIPGLLFLQITHDKGSATRIIQVQP
jgi:outer membrane protein assembly factor BamB